MEVATDDALAVEDSENLWDFGTDFLGRLSEDRIGLVMCLNCRGINAKYAVRNFALVLSFGEC